MANKQEFEWTVGDPPTPWEPIEFGTFPPPAVLQSPRGGEFSGPDRRSQMAIVTAHTASTMGYLVAAYVLGRSDLYPALQGRLLEPDVMQKVLSAIYVVQAACVGILIWNLGKGDTQPTSESV